ncbi:hypothetical protein CDL15_Pgr007931 [Punica granatum]|nr:hypothetical protein CDL15_Pgr007931 [Punica granatum]
MLFKYSLFLILLLFFFIPSSDAFNITKILSQYPDFSTFNDGLTQTGVAGAINSRQTITVLAVDNGGMSGISGDALKKVLSLHVVLDYYDVQKFRQLPNKSDTLTTLFQTSGQANGKQGFLNVTRTSNGVVFGSGVPGSSLNSNLVKSITSQPYNISVLQVSSAIVPPNGGGIGSGSNSSSNSTGSPSPTSAPSKSPPTGTPTSSPAGSPPLKSNATASAPSNSSSGSASSPSDASSPSGASSPSNANGPSNSTADSPSNAAAPTVDAPTASTPATSSPTAPPADAPAADAPGGRKSSGAHTRPYIYLGLSSAFGAIAWSSLAIV